MVILVRCSFAVFAQTCFNMVIDMHNICLSPSENLNILVYGWDSASQGSKNLRERSNTSVRAGSTPFPHKNLQEPRVPAPQLP